MEELFGFDVAVASLKKGLRVSRKAYTGKEYLHVEGSLIYITIENNDFEFAADSEHILAEDWFLILDN